MTPICTTFTTKTAKLFNSVIEHTHTCDCFPIPKKCEHASMRERVCYEVILVPNNEMNSVSTGHLGYDMSETE